jgi:phthiocerol/phenolphthiocerol synthesis type-I polyketide synthase E
MNSPANAVAVIGIACRFPQAEDARQLWRNLCDGLEAIRFFSDQELVAAGVAPEALLEPGYVKAAPVLDAIEEFDAGFFGFTPREAEILDPQQRLLLECAYRALEDAGHARIEHLGDVGVYVGVSSSSYLQTHLATRPDVIDSMGVMALSIANDKDFAASQIAYRLGLTGPAVNIATACSTSLVAIHTAYNAVLNYECDLALAGGASVRARQIEGYQYLDGGVLSPDGHCRPFSAGANGTIGGSGAAVVVLKRLADAQADGDAIYAVITGSAVNNDGADRLGFTAPSVTGQARAIREAMAVAGVAASGIGYVEAHGTATPMGDPVELAALTEAHGDEPSRCAIGSIKSNFGHLDAAAGVAGFIKASLAVRAGEIPPSLHFDAPNPQIDFAKSRFFVADRHQAWPIPGLRHAGISSFGIGGTNAHLVLQQAPLVSSTASVRSAQLFVLSAKDARALERARAPLAAAISGLAADALADASHSLIAGRPELAHRAAFVAASTEEARDAIEGSARWVGGRAEATAKVVWLLPGQGAQHVDMARELWEQEPVFRDAVDGCAEWVRRHAGWDPIELLYPTDSAQRERAELQIKDTRYTQTALFIVEYALAQLWRSLGHAPDLMLGHSLGEYVAACIAGVMDPHDALRLVDGRSRMISALPAGAMLSVALSAEALQPILVAGVELSASNAPELCVVGGTDEAVTAMEAVLAGIGAQTARLDVSHAFHTSMLEPMLADFRALVASIPLRAPSLPYLSCTTGRYVEPDEACSPDYWVRHLRHPVDFRSAMSVLSELPETWRFLDLGPSGTTTAVARHNGIVTTRLRRSLPREHDTVGARHAWLTAVGQLWADGVALDLAQLHAGERRRRVHLPGYAFARSRHWIEAADPALTPAAAGRIGTLPLYRAAWKSHPGPRRVEIPERIRLVFDSSAPAVAQVLGPPSPRCIQVHAAAEFAYADNTCHLRANAPEDFTRLFAALAADGINIEQIIFAWPLALSDQEGAGDGIHNLQIALAALLTARKQSAPAQATELLVLVRHAYQLAGDDPVLPTQRAMAAMTTVLAQEEADWNCRLIDLGKSLDPDTLARALAVSPEPLASRQVALRGSNQWLPAFDRLARVASTAVAWSEKIVVIVGGLGAIGSELARLLAQRRTTLILVGRRPESALDAQARSLLLRLQAEGARITYRAVDIVDTRALSRLLHSVRAQHGRIDLLLHAAAAMDMKSMKLLAASGPGDFERHNQAKIAGCEALIAATREVEVAQVVLMSSLAATLGGLGMSAYAASNAFMDGLVEAPTHWQLRGSWYSIAWDGLSADPAREHAFNGEEVLTLIATVIADHPPGFYLASRRDINHSLRQWGTQAGSEERACVERDPARGNYLAPSNDVERIIAEAFETLIGVRPIGASDDFFALGGDSLLATQLCSRLRQRCKVDLAISAIFEHPVVAKLAAHVIGLQGAGAIGDEELLALVRSLADLDEASLAEALAK